MINFLYTILGFLVAISILIAFHEFGHYWVAKRLGVKVLRYSIGFGKPIWRKTAGPDKTEYVIAALPLGGYVKMLDEREGEVAEAERHRAFNRQKIWKRFAIVFAGPAFNLILGILAFALVAFVGSKSLKPVIAGVIPDSPAAVAGLQKGMEIKSVNGWKTATWDAVFQEALPALVKSSELRVRAGYENGIDHSYTVSLRGHDPNQSLMQPYRSLGIMLFADPPVVGSIAKEAPARRAGLKPGDRIIELNNQPIQHWTDIGEYASRHPDQAIVIKVKRNDQILEINTHTYSRTEGDKKIGLVGISPPKREIQDNDWATQKFGLAESFVYALHRTWTITTVTFRAMWLIASTRMSASNISGPISIAVTAGESARTGWNHYVIFLALVSISLGILNLLPIPILDGGHLMYYVYEMISGKPVSETVEYVGQRIGIALLMMLMALAFYNDIMRYLHW